MRNVKSMATSLQPSIYSGLNVCRQIPGLWYRAAMVGMVGTIQYTPCLVTTINGFSNQLAHS